MRRNILLVVTAAVLGLGGSVVTADSADARRNLGGTQPEGAVCLAPGGEVVRAPRATALLSCFCYLDGFGVSNCPPGVLGQQSRPDRNLGG